MTQQDQSGTGAAEKPRPSATRSVANCHILLLGPSREVHTKARRLGPTLTLLSPSGKLKGRDLSIYDRVIGLPAKAPMQEWVEMAQLVSRLNTVHAIGGFSEEHQEHAAYIAQALGLPFHGAGVIRATRQKDEMRQRLRAAGLDDTPFATAHGREDVEAFGEAHGYPLVLKPSDGRGSLGVSIVRSQQEVATGLDWFGTHAAGRHQMMVERFLHGEEWSVEAFSENGQHRIVCITQKFKDPVTSVETGHCLPARLPDEIRSSIETFVVAALAALGVRNGPSHTELIVTPDGPRMVETHARLAGDSIVELIRLASGVDLDELWVRQVGGETVLADVPAELAGYSSVAFVTPRAAGTLERVEGLDDARALPGVHQVEALQDPGAIVQGAFDSFSRGGFAIAVGDTPEQATQRAREASSRIRFIVSCSG